MSKSFFNTLDLSGADLEKATARAAGQDQLISAIFRSNPQKRIAPSQLQKLIAAKYGRHLLITSVRRSCTTLTGKGVLTKCDKQFQIMSPNGEKENVWQYNEAGDTRALETFMADLQSGKLEERPTVVADQPRRQPSAAPQGMHCEPKGFVQLQMFV